MDTENLMTRIRDFAFSIPGNLIPWAFAALIVILLLYIVYKILQIMRKNRNEEDRNREPGIDVRTLGDEEPPKEGPVLEFYNIPSRIAAVILAPGGRRGELPDSEGLEKAYEAILPGLSDVIAAQKPQVRYWPPQLSAQGFAYKVFRNCPLPSSPKGESYWCAVAGIFRMEGQPLAAGLILRTQRATAHTQKIITEPEGWLDSLSVKME